MIFQQINVLYHGQHYTQQHYEEFKEQHQDLLHNTKRLAIVMRRTPAMLFAIMMCLENGITYIPIDPSYPLDRVQTMLRCAGADRILSDSGRPISLPSDFSAQDGGTSDAYIIFTSGTTGEPKGVVISQAALHNFIEGLTEVIDFRPGQKIACFTTVSFDIFFLESILALQKGVTVCLADEMEQASPRAMARLLRENQVELLQMTPSRMQMLINYDKTLSSLSSVQTLMLGGESFPPYMFKMLKNGTKAKIYNMYGPTETTIWATIGDLTYKDRITLGRPIKNMEIYIVDENLSILPDGQIGEICIAGKGLAKRYVGRDDLTAEKFICLPQKSDVKVYRTGDIGRYLYDGELEFLGRTDNQVKIRGHRIELEEIESYLNKIDGIHQSIVIVVETSETDRVLQAFYTSDGALNQKKIADYLSSKLPEYMIPVTFKRVKDFIRTANGKIDRKRVLECAELKVDDVTLKEFDLNELNDVQRRAFEVIKSTLDYNAGDVTLKTNLGEVGIDSITFVALVVALENEFDFEWDNEMLLLTAFSTVKSIIDYVELETFK